ncbi:magnesium transporter CorA family protein [Chitinophagaceae bacterium LWZ2-11]
MIQYFKIIDQQTIEIDKPEHGTWVNLVPPFKEEEFIELSETLDIPIEFLRDSLDIDERPRYELEDNSKFIVIKTPTENNSFNDSDAFYITIPICIILTHNQIVTVNSFDNGAIKKFLNTFQKRNPDRRNMMVLKIFEKVVQTYMDFLKEFNQKRNQYETSLYESNSNADLLNLMRIQKSLVYFVTALKSNELLMMKMERSNFLGLNEEEREFLNDLIVDAGQASEMANIYANILKSTLDAFGTIVNNNLNNVMKRLTSITIILAFPTLIAIVCGMSHQHSWGAFYLPVIAAFLISIGISWALMKKKLF